MPTTTPLAGASASMPTARTIDWSKRPDNWSSSLGNGVLDGKNPLSAKWNHSALIVALFFLPIISLAVVLVIWPILFFIGVKANYYLMPPIMFAVCYFALMATLFSPNMEKVPEQGTVELLRTERFAGFLLPGWRWIFKPFEKLGVSVSYREESWQLTPAEAERLGLEPIVGTTSEPLNLPVDLNFIFFVHPLDNSGGVMYWQQAAYQWIYGFKNEDELRQGLFDMARGKVRDLASGKTWDLFLADQVKISGDVRTGAQEMFEGSPGLEVKRVNVLKIVIPEAIQKAAEALITGDKEAKVQELKGSGKGKAMEREAEGYRKARELLIASGVDKDKVDELLTKRLAIESWIRVAEGKGNVVISDNVKKVELNIGGERD